MTVTPKSAVSITVSIAFASGGFTPCFLYWSSHGAWFSKYCAFAAISSIMWLSFVGDGDEALRGRLRAARVAVDLDESVREVDVRVVANPQRAELQPVVEVAGLVEADQRIDDRALSRLGEFPGLPQIVVRA